MITNAGDVEVESAYDAQTGLYMHNCFKSHKDYPEWAKEQIALGREIRTITIAKLCDHMDETRERVQ